MNQDQTQEIKPSKKKKKKLNRFLFIVIGIVLLIVTSGASWFLGSREGQKLRTVERDKVALENATTQYQLGVRELEEGRYDNARKRFEYVIKLVPDFPGAQEKLTEVMIAQSIVNTPTPAPEPTVEPTPDYRGEQELYDQALQYVQQEDWDNAIATLDLLRDKNLNFNPVDVDGLYYISLRNRGVKRILQEGSLEPGMYDLTLSERFAPLDNEADSYRVWARYYLTGASFWGLDWSQVVSIFGQIYPVVPNLMDSSGMTARERYRVGLIKWGDQLALQKDYCLAQEKYDLAFTLFVDESVSPAATAIHDACQESKKPKETEAPQETMTPTPTLTSEVTLEPTIEPTQETVIPTEENSSPGATPTP